MGVEFEAEGDGRLCRLALFLKGPETPFLYCVCAGLGRDGGAVLRTLVVVEPVAQNGLDE